MCLQVSVSCSGSSTPSPGCPEDCHRLVGLRNLRESLCPWGFFSRHQLAEVLTLTYGSAMDRVKFFSYRTFFSLCLIGSRCKECHHHMLFSLFYLWMAVWPLYLEDGHTFPSAVLCLQMFTGTGFGSGISHRSSWYSQVSFWINFSATLSRSFQQ